MPKKKFIIAPHMRLHEWIAEHDIISAEELGLGKKLYGSSTVSLSA